MPTNKYQQTDSYIKVEDKIAPISHFEHNEANVLEFGQGQFRTETTGENYLTFTMQKIESLFYSLDCDKFRLAIFF